MLSDDVTPESTGAVTVSDSIPPMITLLQPSMRMSVRIMIPEANERTTSGRPAAVRLKTLYSSFSFACLLL